MSCYRPGCEATPTVQAVSHHARLEIPGEPIGPCMDHSLEMCPEHWVDVQHALAFRVLNNGFRCCSGCGKPAGSLDDCFTVTEVAA